MLGIFNIKNNIQFFFIKHNKETIVAYSLINSYDEQQQKCSKFKIPKNPIHHNILNLPKNK